MSGLLIAMMALVLALRADGLYEHAGAPDVSQNGQSLEDGTEIGTCLLATQARVSKVSGPHHHHHHRGKHKGNDPLEPVEEEEELLVPVLPRPQGFSPLIFIPMHQVGAEPLAAALLRLCDTYKLQCAGYPQGVTPGETIPYNGLVNMTANHSAGSFHMWANPVVLYPSLLDALVPNSTKVALFRTPYNRMFTSFQAALLDGRMEQVNTSLRQLRSNEEPRALCEPAHLPIERCCGPADSEPMWSQVSPSVFSTLDFVLLDEELDRSLLMLSRFANISSEDLLYLRTPQDMLKTSPSLTDAERELLYDAQLLFGELNHTPWSEFYLDNCFFGNEAAVYRAAQDRFDEQYQALNASEKQELEHELVLFQDALDTLSTCCTNNTMDRYCFALSETNYEWHERHGFAVRPESLPWPLDARTNLSDLNDTLTAALNSLVNGTVNASLNTTLKMYNIAGDPKLNATLNAMWNMTLNATNYFSVDSHLVDMLKDILINGTDMSWISDDISVCQQQALDRLHNVSSAAVPVQ